MNPNNCATCRHKQHWTAPAGGWCYMFRDEPVGKCMQHTGRYRPSIGGISEILRALQDTAPQQDTANKP